MWKLRYATPNWVPGSVGCDFLCRCEGETVTWNDPPLLFDITADPSEERPLDTMQEKYKKIVAVINSAVEDHKANVAGNDVVRQDVYWRMFWRPWLQPCCNFPHCHCKEKNTWS